MDRETLTYMLRSGRFLCYDPGNLDNAVRPRVPDAPLPQSDVMTLFDSPYLSNAVFFKEAYSDDNDEFSVGTRVMFVFNEHNALEGGASVTAEPDELEDALEKWYGGKIQIGLSLHDRNVLEVFCKTPTFDPFLLLAQRRDIERDRAVDTSSFDIDAGTADDVRAIVNARAAALVNLAMGEGVEEKRTRATVNALEEAIWRCEANQRTGRLFKSLGVPADKTDRILFAWKGIAYYEYLFRNFATDYAEFLIWLRSPQSLPRDMSSIENRRAYRLKSLRRTSQTVMRGYYTHATEILKKHANAYDALLGEGNPEPFQKFLLAAPKLFETLGLSIGSFGHASNAWKSLTNNGRRPNRNAEALEGFYRFISTLAAAKLE
ncbi:MAG: hypothetical protein R8L07_06005 [Alphaproteobacteria bacterium]|nr:hypothetical protein [Alphaproteobacteria bacterium]